METRKTVKINFAFFWDDFSLSTFEAMFPAVARKYDLELSDEPEVIFYSAFAPTNPSHTTPDGRYIWLMPELPEGKYLRVFITGENIEPLMDRCDFAISFSALVDHPNHLRLPLWIYENRVYGFSPESIIKPHECDWEKVASEKTQFCNFIYTHDVEFRDDIFRRLNDYKRVDAAGRCMNNMAGWQVPNEKHGKIEYIQKFKFTLAIENTIWPGYQTEKLTHPMLVNSIPIYVGDPLARNEFNTGSYVDFTCFRTLREMLEFVEALDQDPKLYLDVLSTPWYRGNAVPKVAQDDVLLAFFDRIFTAARAVPD